MKSASRFSSIRYMADMTVRDAVRVIIIALVEFPGLKRPLNACLRASDLTSAFFIKSNINSAPREEIIIRAMVPETK